MLRLWRKFPYLQCSDDQSSLTHLFYDECSYDIYISRRIGGKWTPSRNLGPKVNTAFRDYSPGISPDGRYLFFTSEKDFSAGKKGVSSYGEFEKSCTAC
ncbi:MAG TPA: hypothetical protein VHC48_05385 [Puia sp.]|nr:hypothetical protein [Puia sp.]